MSNYTIAGGMPRKERLKLVSAILLPTTLQLLETAGIAEGMNCLDVGCGGGFVSRLMADLVGPDGKVTGTDIDESILALAREDAKKENRTNVEFCLADAANCPGDAEYDLVYARFILTHLCKPMDCLQSMMSAAKPGGLIVVEDIEFKGSFCYPFYPAYERYLDLYQQVVLKRGADPNIGPKLPGMLRDAGIKDVKINVVQPTHIEGEGKLISSITMALISESVVSEGLAAEDEVNQISSDLEKAAYDPNYVISVPRIFQVWGRRC